MNGNDILAAIRNVAFNVTEEQRDQPEKDTGMNKIYERLKELETDLTKGLPWLDDPHTVYTAHVTPGGFTPDGRYYLAHTELIDEFHGYGKGYPETNIQWGIAVLDPKTGELLSHKNYEWGDYFKE